MMKEYWGEQLIWLDPTLASRTLVGSARRFVHRAVHKSWRYFRSDHAIDDWYDPRLDAIIGNISALQTYDCVIAEYVFMSRALLAFDGKVRKLLDTHDAFSLRTRRFRSGGISEYTWFPLSCRQERKGLKRADAVIAIQSEEADYFRGLGSPPVFEVGHIVEILEYAGEPPDHVISFVGSNNRLNVEGCQWFADRVFPLLASALPSVRWDVVGLIGSAMSHLPSGAKAVGTVESLTEVYRRSSVIINPVQNGSGLAIKTIEALGACRPVVCSQVGARGLDNAIGNGLVVANSPEEMAGEILRLLRDPGLRRSLALRANTFASEWNTRQTNALRAALEDPIAT